MSRGLASSDLERKLRSTNGDAGTERGAIYLRRNVRLLEVRYQAARTDDSVGVARSLPCALLATLSATSVPEESPREFVGELAVGIVFIYAIKELLEVAIV